MLKRARKFAVKENRTMSELMLRSYREYERKRRWDDINKYGREKAAALGIRLLVATLSQNSSYTVGIFDGWKALRQFSIGTKPTSATSLVMPFRLKKPSSATGMIRSSSKNNTLKANCGIWPWAKLTRSAAWLSSSPFVRAGYVSSPLTL